VLKKLNDFLRCNELSELSSQAPYPWPFSLHQVALSNLLSIGFPFRFIGSAVRFLAFRKNNIRFKQAKRRQPPFHSDNETAGGGGRGREVSSGHVNFCYEIGTLTQLITRAKYIDISLTQRYIVAFNCKIFIPKETLYKMENGFFLSTAVAVV